MRKTFLFALIFTTILLTTVLLFIFPASAEMVYGCCGENYDNVKWHFDTDTGELYIYGTGYMQDYSSFGFGGPWNKQDTAVKSVRISDGVQNIGRAAFKESRQLKSIELPDSLIAIEGYAFSKCVSLSSIAIPNSVKSIGNDAFEWCQKLDSITIPNSVKDIGTSAFSCCTNLSSVVLSNQLAEINSYTFQSCTKLKSILIPDSVKRVKYNAFLSCNELIQIKNGVSYVDKWAIQCDSDITCVILKSDLVGIADYTFSALNNLSTIYYHGTPEQWSTVYIGEYNTKLTEASVLQFADCTYSLWNQWDEEQHQKICICGKTTSEYAPHSWDNGEIITSPTCLLEGSMIYNCTACTAYKTESIPMLAHSYGQWTPRHDEHIRVCICGKTEKASHIWNDGEITTEPTHFSNGERTYTCTVCEKKKIEVLYQIQHVFDKWKPVNDSNHEQACVCGYKDRQPHNWNEGEITLPTHFADGVEVYTCIDCGATIAETLPKAEHIYSDWIQHSDTEHKKCCACGDIQYESHDWELHGTSINQSEEGYYEKQWYFCISCNAEKEEVIIEKAEEQSDKIQIEFSSGCDAAISNITNIFLLISLGSMVFVCKKKRK